MINHESDNWSLCLGRPGGIPLRLHILWPLIGLVILLAVKSDIGIDATVAGWALVVYFSSVTLYEFMRLITATRVGGYTSAVVLGPIGGLTKIHLPIDPPAHLVTALAGPMTYLVLMVTAGCGLALAEEHNVAQLLLHPCSPAIASPDAALTATLLVIGQLTVWVNWCLLLISLLPVEPCAGAELLRGILWPMLGRSTANSVTSRVAIGLAVVTALLAVLLAPNHSSELVIPISYVNGLIPTWFPLALISIFLLYGGNQSHQLRRYDAGLSFDEFDSDDEAWLLSDWDEDDREAVLVEHVPDKQQEVIDRKRREREANEDAQVDAILMRLRDVSFEQLSEEDRATLKRASRRYRQRRSELSDELGN